MITKDNKDFIATHWDGYSESLGRDLVDAFTDDEIIGVAHSHTIDFADVSILPQLNRKRYRSIARKTKGKYSTADITKLHQQNKLLLFGIMRARDYPIQSIDGYDDYASYQYDLSKGVWRFRPVYGIWQERQTPKRFKRLAEWMDKNQKQR